MNSCTRVGIRRRNLAARSRRSCWSSFRTSWKTRPHIASVQSLAEGPGGKQPDDRGVERKQPDRREEIAQTAAFEKNRFQDGEVVARRNQIGEPLDRRRHLLDGKGEAREQRRGQQGRHKRDLARADLAAD